MVCQGCNKSPADLKEYIDMGDEEGMSAEEYCWSEEGTLNRSNGHFLCTGCYCAAGMPSSPRGWVCP